MWGFYLRNSVVLYLQNFITSLLVDSKDGPIRICSENERRLKIQIESRLKATRLICDVRKDRSWKRISIKVENLWIVDENWGINIVYDNISIIFLSYLKFSIRSTKCPIPQILDTSKSTKKVYFQKSCRKYIILLSYEIGYIQLFRNLIIWALNIISTDHSHDTPVIYIENGANSITFT